MASDPGAPPEAEVTGTRPLPRYRVILLNRRLWLGAALGAGCLMLAMFDIDFAEMAEALRSANKGWVAVAGLTVLATGWAKAWRWRLLLTCPPDPPLPPPPPAAAQISLPRLTNIWMAGAGVNLALPVPRGGDVLRVYLAGEAGVGSKSLVLGTIAAEKLLDVVMLAICFLGLLLFVALPEELAQRQPSVVGVAALMVLVVAAFLWQREWVLAQAGRVLRRLPFGARVVGSLERGLHGLAALRQPGRLLALATLTVGIWFVAVLTNYIIFLALDMPPSWVQSLFVLVVLQVGVAVPSTPGKIGLFQVLCRWALGVFGVSAALGLAYGVLLYLAAPLLLMLVGALALAIEGWRVGRLPVELDTALSGGS
jgi:glycosyltransferase 2 family protein